MSEFRWAGEISHGTLRTEDLIPRFRDLVLEMTGGESNPVQLSCLNEAMEKPGFYESADADWFLEDLFDALNALAPDGYWFGSHEGDGSSFGFWECEDDLDED